MQKGYITLVKKSVVCKEYLAQSYLTLGKEYTVMAEDCYNYKVVNDIKEEWWYDKRIFKQFTILIKSVQPTGQQIGGRI